MRSMFLKELKQLIPYAWLMLLFGGLNLPFIWLTTYPELTQLSDVWDVEVNGTVYPILHFFFGFSLALGLLVREQDLRTVEFLDGLPVSRLQIFWGKVMAAFVILALFPVSDALCTGFLLKHSALSFYPPTPWPVLFTHSLLCLIQLIFFFSFGLAASFLRRFAWLTSLVGLSLILLVQYFWPGFSQLNPLGIVAYSFRGSQIVIPWTSVGLSLVLSLIFLSFAFACFRSGEGRWSKWYRNLAQTWWGGILLFGVLIATVIGFFVFAMVGFWQSESFADEIEAAENGEEYIEYVGERKPATVDTDHFEFWIPSYLEKASARLAARSDEVGEEVASFFNHQLAIPIEVEISDSLHDHFAGLALWGRVRIAANQVYDTDEAVAILGHEVTHVLIDRLSDRRLKDSFESTKMFHEGLATYLEYRMFRSPDEWERYRIQGAVYHARRQVKFKELVDYPAFRERYDPVLVYPYGERFAQAIVDQYGDEAVGKVVRAFSRKDAPRDLSGMELWRDVLQSCDYDLDRVVNRFYVRLNEDAKKHADYIAALPRLKAKIEVKAAVMEISVINPPKDREIVCVIRPAADSDETQYRRANKVAAGKFRIPRTVFPGNRFWYLLKYEDETADAMISEPWVKVSF
jgi:hypothetical protein